MEISLYSQTKKSRFLLATFETFSYYHKLCMSKKKQSTREPLKRIINEVSLLGYENHQRNCVAIYIQHSII